MYQSKVMQWYQYTTCMCSCSLVHAQLTLSKLEFSFWRIKSKKLQQNTYWHENVYVSGCIRSCYCSWISALTYFKRLRTCWNSFTVRLCSCIERAQWYNQCTRKGKTAQLREVHVGSSQEVTEPSQQLKLSTSLCTAYYS